MVLKAPTLTAPRRSFSAAENIPLHGHTPNLSIFSVEINERFCQGDVIQRVSEAFPLTSRWEKSQHPQILKKSLEA